MSNKEIQPLFKANDEMMKIALINSEDETCELLKDPIVFGHLYLLFSFVQEHYKSKKIANTLNETLTMIKEGNGGYIHCKEDIDTLSFAVKKANKYVL